MADPDLVAGKVDLSLQNLHFVAIRVGDESHLVVPGGELLAPATRPDFDAVVLKAVAVVDDVGDAHAGVHEVLGKFDLEARLVSELEEVLVSGEVEEGELVALGGVLALSEFEAEPPIEGNGGIWIGDSDAGVEKLDH